MFHMYRKYAWPVLFALSLKSFFRFPYHLNFAGFSNIVNLISSLSDLQTVRATNSCKFDGRPSRTRPGNRGPAQQLCRQSFVKVAIDLISLFLSNFYSRTKNRVLHTNQILKRIFLVNNMYEKYLYT